MGRHEYRSRLTTNNNGIHIWFEDADEAYEFAYDLNEASRGMRDHDVFHTEAVDGEAA